MRDILKKSEKVEHIKSAVKELNIIKEKLEYFEPIANQDIKIKLEKFELPINQEKKRGKFQI